MCVARLHEQKGIDLLLRALSSPTLRGTDFRLVIVGDGPERGALMRLAASLNLEERTEWIGETSDVHRYFAEADLFVLPSRYEGLPNVVLEAMSWSLPVVATDVGGTSELVLPAETGWLAEPESPESLARVPFRELDGPSLPQLRANPPVGSILNLDYQAFHSGAASSFRHSIAENPAR